MRTKEAQLLGLLAVIAGGIIVLSILTSDPQTEGGPTSQSATEQTAEQTGEGGQGQDLEEWAWLAEELPAEGEAETQAGQTGAEGSLELEGNGTGTRAEGPEYGSVDDLDELMDRSREIEENPPEQIGLQEQEEGQEESSEESEEARPRTYVVQKGDTLIGISRRYYDTAAKWKVILRANRDVLSKPEELRPDMELIIPPLGDGWTQREMKQLDTPLLSQENEDEASPRYYEVEKRETLWSVAGKVYEDPSQWRKIFKANRDLLDRPEDLRDGMRLVIP